MAPKTRKDRGQDDSKDDVYKVADIKVHGKKSPSCDWLGVKALRVVLCWTFTTCLVHDLGTLSQGAIKNTPATCLTFFL